MTIERVRELLEEKADVNYRKFNQNLLPGIDHILGVRLPEMRKIAKQAAKEDCCGYLNEAREKIGPDSYHEEIMMQGFVLGYGKMDKEKRTIYLREFVPKINSWAVCDSCVNSFKFMREDRTYWYDYLMTYADSREEYILRFLLVSLMDHFMEEEYLDRIFDLCNRICKDAYYVKMGVAWAIQVCYIKNPGKTERFLRDNDMDDTTHNKAIQKIRESQKVGREDKERLNRLKREGSFIRKFR